MSRQKAANDSLTKLARAGGNKKALGEYDEKGSQDEAASERPANPREVSVGYEVSYQYLRSDTIVRHELLCIGIILWHAGGGD